MIFQFFFESTNISISLLVNQSQVTSIAKVARPQFCPNENVLQESQPVSRPEKMALEEAAHRIAAEFDYPKDEVTRGVKEFLEEMGTRYAV